MDSLQQVPQPHLMQRPMHLVVAAAAGPPVAQLVPQRRARRDHRALRQEHHLRATGAASASPGLL